MTLLSYQVFQTVIEQGSFAKAAQVLSLTPSAVSHSIAAMEKELGFSLLVRSKSGIALTSYGRQLLPYIHAVLNSEESLKQAIGEINGLQKGVIRIGCFSSVCTNWMADILRDFGRAYPSIEIEVFQGTYADVSGWIKNGTVDFGFLSVSSAGDLPIRPLCEDPLLAVVPPDFQKKVDSAYMSVDELKDCVFVSQMESTDADIVNFFKSNDLRVRSRYHVVDDLSTAALVANGFGICIMPEMVMRDIAYPVRTYPLLPAACRVIGISALNTEFMAPAVRMLYNSIVAQYAST